MPLFRTYRQDDFVAAVWKVDETIEQLQMMFDDFSIYAEEFSCFSVDKRKLEWLAVRVLLKVLCGEEKKIAYFPSGKPYMADGSAHISISHTKGYVAIALHPCAEVGIDIEQYGEKVKRVAHKFIREDEYISIQSGDEIYAMLLHWSAKETIFKLMDANAVDFIEHLHIQPFVPLEQGIMEAEEFRTKRCMHFQINYHTHPDYVLTYAFIPLQE